MTSSQTTQNISNSEDPQHEYAIKPLESSKFNDLSVSLAFAISGLIVVYLPDVVAKSIDWKTEGRLLGIALALIGAGFTLAAASKLTGRSGFSYWGIAIILGTIIASIISVLHVYRLPKWPAIILTLLSISLIIVEVYTLVSGFTIFFDETGKASESSRASSPDEESSAISDGREKKKSSSYEQITLIIAVISTIATLAAAIEPIVHP